MQRRTPSSSPSSRSGLTLARAATRAAGLLGISQAELSRILGVSPATVSRMAAGRYALQRDQKAWQLAALFVRLFRSLDALVGSNEKQARAWLMSQNSALGAEPRMLLTDAEGLVRVVHYLDAARGRI